MCCIRELEQMLGKHYEVTWKDDEYTIFHRGIKMADIIDGIIEIDIEDPGFRYKLMWIATRYDFEIKNLK